MSGLLWLTWMSTWRRIKSITRYRFNFALSIIMSFVWSLGLLIFTLIADASVLRDSIGTANYFSFMLIGIAFQSYYGSALWGSPNEIQNELTTGQIEYTFASPVSRYSYMLSYAFSDALVATVFSLLPMFAIGTLFTGVVPSLSGVFMTLVVLLLTFLVFCQIGVLNSCVLLVFRNISAFMGVMNFLFQIASGMFVPIQLMPNELKVLSSAIPLTHGIDLVRHFLIGSTTIWSVELEIGALVFFLIAFTILAKLAVAYVERKAKTVGLSLA